MILGTAKKEDESYANANCTHRCMCDSMLLWYVYILMKGDDQA